ncbi:hypothetical protein BAU15_14120 [Enterococcus sp. JM4C]|uniref:hypothetical protein n=1 Tax=Candidatus Enterococcus huntleyi TaxID=1857217 RepID=UPI00137B3B68|nr:hypothetical protein [Enterococcus sp. JM4C]KAF1296004.1 hypothetical protein BAU15_14120 [Enterococcus sp. JM4C]
MQLVDGELKHLVIGNHCVLTDGRKTKGFIKDIHLDEGMFSWEITEYEDKGKHWIMRLEEVSQFLFPENSKIIANKSELNDIKKVVERFSETMIIDADKSILLESREVIEVMNSQTKKWLLSHSTFLKKYKKIENNRSEGYPELYQDLENYLLSKDLYRLEEETGSILALNPYSGEWMKGIRYTLAKLGFITFNEMKPRTKDIFDGIGSLENRKNYLLHRMSFLQSLFSILAISHIPIYRGVQTTEEFYNDQHAPLQSWTTSLETGTSFSSFGMVDDNVLNAYLIKFNCPIDQIFMTYFETKAFNKQYKEQEVVKFNCGSLLE